MDNVDNVDQQSQSQSQSQSKAQNIEYNEYRDPNKLHELSLQKIGSMVDT